jgi:hypothetical protein
MDGDPVFVGWVHLECASKDFEQDVVLVVVVDDDVHEAVVAGLPKIPSTLDNWIYRYYRLVLVVDKGW